MLGMLNLIFGNMLGTRLLAQEDGPGGRDVESGGTSEVPDLRDDELIDDDSTGDAGGFILEFLNQFEWALSILSAVGAVMLLFLIIKLVWDRRRGAQQGAGGQVAQVLIGILGLALFFVPEFTATAADFAVRSFINLVQFVLSGVT